VAIIYHISTQTSAKARVMSPMQPGCPRRANAHDQLIWFCTRHAAPIRGGRSICVKNSMLKTSTFFAAHTKLL
jgi:hypothetical protein